MNEKDVKIIIWKYNEKLSEELRNKWYKEIYKSWNNINNWEVNLNIYNVSVNNFNWDDKIYYIPDDVDKLFIIWNNLDREIIKNYFNKNYRWFYLEWMDNNLSPYKDDIILSENNNVGLLVNIIEWTKNLTEI